MIINNKYYSKFTETENKCKTLLHSIPDEEKEFAQVIIKTKYENPSVYEDKFAYYKYPNDITKIEDNPERYTALQIACTCFEELKKISTIKETFEKVVSDNVMNSITVEDLQDFYTNKESGGNEIMKEKAKTICTSTFYKELSNIIKNISNNLLNKLQVDETVGKPSETVINNSHLAFAIDTEYPFAGVEYMGEICYSKCVMCEPHSEITDEEAENDNYKYEIGMLYTDGYYISFYNDASNMGLIINIAEIKEMQSEGNALTITMNNGNKINIRACKNRIGIMEKALENIDNVID